MASIPLIGLLTGLLVALVTYRLMPLARGTAVAQLDAAHEAPEEVVLPAWRAALVPLEAPAGRFTPASWLRKARADLYWAQVSGHATGGPSAWQGWDEVQFWALRFGAAGAAFMLGMFAFQDFVFALAAAFVGFQWPAMRLGGVARRTRRRFLAELPEFIQLIAAATAANLPLDTAIERASQGQSTVAHWFRAVIHAATGKSLLARKDSGVPGALREHAEASLLPELIGLAVQMDFIQQRGTHTRRLLAQLADNIAAQYVGSVEQRAERIGTELVMPMIGFYFLPFLVVILVVLGYPILVGT